MLSKLLRGIRPVDVVLTALLCALGSLLAVMNIDSDDPTTRVDSHSWLLLPVFVAAALPVLWWRRGILTVVLACCAAMALNVLAFGSIVRCGSGLPLAFTLAFPSGLGGRPNRGDRPNVGDRPDLGDRRFLALAATGLLTALVLIRDTAAGLELLPVALVLCGVLFGIARVVAHRSEMAGDLRQQNDELRRVRDERAAWRSTTTGCGCRPGW